jgi:uncharacterized repeat protein (TIGR03803 family)
MFRKHLAIRTSVVAVLAIGAGLAAAPAPAATFQTLYSFTGGADGAAPNGRMVFNAKTGLLYGTTVSGGSGNGGTVFQFDPSANVLTTLYSFTLGGSKGSSPQTPLTLGKNGVLYGVATTGGGSSACSFGCGTIFKFDPATKTLKTLYAFTDQSDGGTPEGGLVFDATKSTVFGTTVQGGDFADCQGGCGTVYKFVLATKGFSTLHAFRSIVDDGADSTAGMVVDGAGVLYGVANGGGPHGSGIVFRLDPTTGIYTVLHGFDYHVDGSGPTSVLLLKGGVLYGTTISGGPTANGYGTIFSMDPGTGATTTLYSFADGNDGIFPSGGLVAGPKSSLYGTAKQGTPSGAGAVFALKTKTDKLTALYDFTGFADGGSPQTGLVAGAGGVLYGVTTLGNGTIFKITP